MPGETRRAYVVEGILPVERWPEFERYLGLLGLSVTGVDTELLPHQELEQLKVPDVNYGNLVIFEESNSHTYPRGAGTRVWNALCWAAENDLLPLQFNNDGSSEDYANLNFESLVISFGIIEAKAANQPATERCRYANTLGRNIGPRFVGFLGDFIKSKESIIQARRWRA